MTYAHQMLRAGLASIAVLAGCLAAHAAPMTFRTMPVGANCGSRCPLMIVAEGDITLSTPDRFVEFVQRQSRDPRMRGVVLINSPGGRVGASMQLGKFFRQAGVAVIVGRAGSRGIAPGNCFSACVYALIGAKKRVIPRVSKIGVHRMVAFDYGRRGDDDMNRYEAVFATPELVQRLSDYVGSMGVSREVISMAERISHDKLRILTPQEIRRWKLGSENF
ncbi:MAG: hypothetical protein Q8M31_05175 [Beijerinckiaceae bacterium]|nr:hypothetical protein [Beijerinckiaceae bacterium]